MTSSGLAFSFLFILVLQITSSVNGECILDGKTYREGEATYVECSSCVCRNGLVECQGNQECKKGVCYNEGKSYADGGYFYDECNSCRCMAKDQNDIGRFACTKMYCPKGYCYHNGKQYQNGNIRKADDGCNTCHCRVRGNAIGRFECTSLQCPAATPSPKAQTVALITGLLKFPPSLHNIPAGSCLVMFMQKAIQCVTCVNPKIGETIVKDIDLSTEKVYRYTLKFPSSVASGIFSVQATLNMGWCKSGNSWIRKGDYMTKYSNEFTVQKQQKRIPGPDIKMERYGRANVQPAAKKNTVLNDDCGDAPIAGCSFKPCAQLYCADNEKAECRENFCGGCNAEFYLNGRKINCENRQCRKACPYNYDPYCGSDGKTYSNLCLIEVAQCEDNSIGIAYKGVCTQPKDTPKCRKACPYNYDPYCGTDDKTYSNLCLMRYAICEDDSINIAYKGICLEKGCRLDGEKYKPGETFINKGCTGQCKCGENGGVSCVSLCPPSFVNCSPGFTKEYTKVQVGNSHCSCERPRCVKDEKKSDVSRPAATKCRKACPYNYDPYCGTDDKTYSNLCLMRYATCEDNSINIAYKGVCLEKGCRIDGEKYKAGETFINKECTGQCKCGENGGISCVSLCPPSDIRCSPGFTKEYIKVRVGNSDCTCDRPRCVEDAKKRDVTRPVPQGLFNDRTCMRPCSRLNLPICGSNGKTYSNLCKLENAQCSNKNLRLEYTGKCGEIILQPSCPRNKPSVPCFKNPCNNKMCLAYPHAKCKPNYCGGCNADFYLGYKKVECDLNKCPKGVPAVNCVSNPCRTARCSEYPHAVCKPNHCGGCKAEFYVTSRKVDCAIPKCLKHKEDIFSRNDERVPLGQYIPQCDKSGEYKLQQCHEGYCWCVNTTTGEIVVGKSLTRGQIDCEAAIRKPSDTSSSSVSYRTLRAYRKVKIVGYLIQKPTITSSIPKGSCLNLAVRRSQYPEVLSKKQVKNMRFLRSRNGKMRYMIDLPNARPGSYEIEATLNLGWCKTGSDKNSEWIRDGDYHTQTAQILQITKGSSARMIRHDVEIEQVILNENKNVNPLKTPSNEGIITGNVVLKGFIQLPLKYGSCLHVYAQEEIYCYYCDNPYLGEYVEINPEVINNRIPYKLTIDSSKIKSGRYIVHAILNNGWCKNENEWIRYNDFHNDVSHTVQLPPKGGVAQKDIVIERYQSRKALSPVESSAVVITGDVILPYGAPVYFSKESCLELIVQKDIQGSGNPILASIKMSNLQVNHRRIPFKIVSKKLMTGDFTIQATLNNGWCYSEGGAWIRSGDYHNDFAVMFSLENGQLLKEIDVNIVEYKERRTNAPKTAKYEIKSNTIPVFGNIRLPNYADLILKRDSCVHFHVQESIYCEFCYNKILHNETMPIANGLPSRYIPYEISLPRLKPSSYLISVTLNNGGCRSISESRRNGDFFNDEAHEFEISQKPFEKIQKDIKVIEYVIRNVRPSNRSIQKT